MYLNATSNSAWNGTLLQTNVTQLPTLQDLLEMKLGPKHRHLAEVIVLLVIYGLVFISGTVGNVLTCIVILKNNYMRTTTNYYLLSLAISDVLILLIGLPPEAYTLWEAYPWRFGKEICIIKSYSAEVTSYASVLTITAFTVERYIAICRPLKSHKIVPTTRCIRIIAAIWVISICCALPFPLHTELFYYVYDLDGNPIPDSLQCNIPPRYSSQMVHMFQMSTFVFFVFPVTVIIVLYTLIGLTLWKAGIHRRTSDEYTPSKIRQGSGAAIEKGIVHVPRKSVLRVLVAVVVAFFVCWAPFHAQRLFTVFNKHWTPFLFDLQTTLFYISGVLYFIGSTVNPILYNVMSRRYRLAFMHTICHTREQPRHFSSYRLTNGNSTRTTTSQKRIFRGTHTVDDKIYDVLLRFSSNSSFDKNRLMNAEKKHVAMCKCYGSDTLCNDIALVTDNVRTKTNEHLCSSDVVTTYENHKIVDVEQTASACQRCSIMVNLNFRREMYKRLRSLSNGHRETSQESTDSYVNGNRRLIANDLGAFV